MKNFPEIRTQNYLLRQIGESDLENIYRGLSDENVIEYYGISFDSLEATNEQINWYAELEQNQTGIWWAISSLNRDTFFGAIGYNNHNAEFKKAELGFWILPEFWKNGVVSEVLPPVCEYGFSEYGLNRIEAQVESENTACKRVMNKFHFVHEGTLREYEIKNGRYIDLEVFSKLASDK